MIQEQPDPAKLEAVYRLAITARDMEISQLLQRNNFFMIFQGVLFAGLLQASETSKIPHVVGFLVCFAGFLVSIMQIGMAAGAKFWQERWEHAVETAEKKLFPNSLSAEDSELFRVFSSDKDSINAIVEARMRGKRLGWLVTQRFSPSRIPIYTAMVFAATWLLLPD